MMPATDVSSIAPSANLRVVDPVARTVWTLPLSALEATRGLTDYLSQSQPSRDISLCCLYQRRRCRAEQQCRQVHADRGLVAALRSQMEGPHCCDACMKKPTSGNQPNVRLTGRAALGMPLIPADRVIPTLGLKRAPASAPGLVDVAWSDVCRLQLQDACKYGSECRNVHLCPHLGKTLLAQAAVNVNAAVPDAVRSYAASASRSTSSVSSDSVARSEGRAADATPPPAAEKKEVPMDKTPDLDNDKLELDDVDIDGLIFRLPDCIAKGGCAALPDRHLFSPFTRGGGVLPPSVTSSQNAMRAATCSPLPGMPLRTS